MEGFSCESLGADSLSCCVTSVLLHLTCLFSSLPLRPKAQSSQDPGLYGVVQSGDHIGRTCVVKWFKLKSSGDDVEVSAGASACWNQLRESSHETAQASQINTDKPGSQLCSGVCP